MSARELESVLFIEAQRLAGLGQLSRLSEAQRIARAFRSYAASPREWLQSVRAVHARFSAELLSGRAIERSRIDGFFAELACMTALPSPMTGEDSVAA